MEAGGSGALLNASARPDYQKKQPYKMANASPFTAQISTSPKLELGESRTNLIINYLPQGMNQEEVRALFSSIGEIESCKLVRDKMSGQSLGYGFVNYIKDEDASRAVASFNGLRLQNKTIKVSFARPSAENIKGSNLYVSGLPKSMTQRELEGLFRSFGQIITSRILSDNITGLSKGVGFVRFDKRCEAEIAIDKLNNTVPVGCTDQITVKFANNPANNPTKTALHEATTLATASQSLISPLSLLAANPTVAAQRLLPNVAAAASGCGPLRTTTRGVYRYNPLAGVPLAAAPTAMSAATADYLTTQALLQMAGVPSAASLASLSALSAVPTSMASAGVGVGAGGAGYTLFVYNLSADTEDAVLWALFGPFGAVQSVKIIRDFATGKCKGYGFVVMGAYEEALGAIAALNGSQLGNRTIQIREADAATIYAVSAQEMQSQLGMFQGLHGSYELGALM